MLSFDVIFGNWFDNSERHHLTREAIAFIPTTLHRSIPHSLLKHRSMDSINNATIGYYRTKDPAVANEIMGYLRLRGGPSR
jgi:hypothetical protein